MWPTLSALPAETGWNLGAPRGVEVDMRFDSADVRGIADRIDDAAELIGEALSNHLSRFAFDGAQAGRDYAACGDRLRAALDRLAAEVSQWSRAADAIAVALRAGADRYAEAELYAAARIA